MTAFTVPRSWGKLDSQAQQSFGAGKEAVLLLLHNIMERLDWASVNQYNLIYCAGWLDGVLHAQRELERAQKYPDTLRDLNSMLDDVSDQYRSDLKSEGRKMGVPVEITDSSDITAEQPAIEIFTCLQDLLEKDIYPRPVPTAMFILFSKSINPNSIYHRVIDGFSAGYTQIISKADEKINTVIGFRRSRLPRFDQSDVFINNYIFASENSSLIINAKLFMNPLWEKSVLRVLNENDGKLIAEAEVENRSYRALQDMKGQEDDFLLAGQLLLDSLINHQNAKLIKQLTEQASKHIIEIVIDDLSALIQDVYDKPFAEHVKRLENFSPVSRQYKNFIARHGYQELIDQITEYLSQITNLSAEFFSELDQLLNELKKTVEY